MHTYARRLFKDHVMAEPKYQKRVTSVEIADFLGISQATVSRALAGNRRISQKVRDQVQETARSMGYVSSAVARTLARGRSGVVGILSGGLHIERTASEIIALDAALRNHGFRPYISYTRSEPDRILEGARHLVEQGVDGLMVIGVSPGTAEEGKYQKLTQLLPAVFVDSPLAGHGINLVAHDYLTAYREAAQTLLERGCRHVYGLWEYNVPSDISASYDSRYKGFQALLSHFGNPHELFYAMPSITPPVLHDTRTASAEFRDRLCRFFERHPQCDALICHSDQLAISAMTYLMHKKREVPERIALLGFDNNLLGERIEPALSTIAQQPNKLAEAAVKRLLELIAEPENEPKTIYVPGIFIRRETL